MRAKVFLLMIFVISLVAKINPEG
uniref:Uncharacterized protein n=1 Tax=Rhizophora mucronata TaxID=61149 RepID=A0A2P2PE62_RHIMU